MRAAPSKPTLLIVTHGITPYGTHFLRRVAEELREYALRTVHSYEFGNGHWNVPQPDSINAVTLGRGEETGGLDRLVAIRSGWRRHREIVREIQAAQPSAVVVFGYGWLAHYLTIRWCQRRQIPLLLWGDSNIRADVEHGVKAWIKRRVLTGLIGGCAAVLPCGTLGARYFERYGARSEQIFFMPYEPDYEMIEKADPALVAELAGGLALRPERRRIVYAGRLVPIKRVDLLIDAFARIADVRPGWDLLIAGGGPEEAALRSRVPTHLRDRVAWAGYIESPQRMLALYRLGDALVLPSSWEPWAVVVNEAACAGLALVCSDVVGAAAELLRDGVNGRSFKANDADSLTAALLDVTEEARLSRYQVASREILTEWRKAADPVDGLRKALQYSLSPLSS